MTVGTQPALSGFPDSFPTKSRQAETDTSGLAHVAHAGNARYNGDMHSLDWLNPADPLAGTVLTWMSEPAATPAPLASGWVRLQDAVRAGTHRRTIQRWVADGHLPSRREDESNPRSCLYVDAARLADLQSTSGRELPPTVSGVARR